MQGQHVKGRLFRKCDFGIAVVTICMFAASATAQENQILEELFQSETVFPQGESEIQITLTPQILRGQGEPRFALPAVVEYGITDAFQVEAEWTSYRSSAEGSGIGDLEIGARYSWMNISGSSVHAAAGLELTLPIGDESDDFGEGELALEPMLILAADIPAWVGAQAVVNLGTEFGEKSSDLDDSEWFVNLGFFAPLGALVATAEWNWSQQETYVTPGFVWHPAPETELGLGISVGLNDDSDDFRIIVSFTIEFDAN